ncbi:hypothetical protein KCU65_g6977, partial [Aureobasidium melanogenum]
MAIIPDVPHVVVDIVVDGRPLPEYLDQDDDDSVSHESIIKYVECVSGSHFGIRVDLTGMEFKHLKRGNSIITDYYLDGQVVACAVHRFPLGHLAVTTRPAARYREDGTWKERNFMFADLVTSEEGLSNKLRSDLKDLGTITVKHFYAHSNWSREAPFLDFPKVNVGQEVVHEKNLKGQAISNQAKLGEEVALGYLSTVDSRRLGNAFAEFQFRYRSRKDLQTLYLVPRSPSPVPLEDRPEETLNREELLELLRRQKTRQEQKIAIKQELKRERIEDDESDNDQIVISSRPPAKQLKVFTDADTGIDTIDLTDA